MSMKVFTHADGGIYAQIRDDVPIKDDATGEWLPGVLYIAAADEQVRSTTAKRWRERFTQSDYEGDDPAVLAMLRRANPVDSGLDYIRVFESWGEREADLTAVMLDLAVATTLVKTLIEPTDHRVSDASIRLTVADLRQISERYEIKREHDSPHAWTIRVARIPEISSSEG